MTEQLTH